MRAFAELPLPTLEVLDLRVLPPILAGLAFSWLGLLGSLIAVLPFYGFDLPGLLVGDAVLGGGLLLCVRWIPGFGRAFPNLRSYFVFCAGVTLAALPHSALVTLDLFGAFSWRSTWLWWASTMTTTIVLAPPLLVGLGRFLRRWIDPWPGEAERRAPLVIDAASGPMSRLGPPWVGPLLATALVVALLWSFGGALEGSRLWLNLLFVLPLLWAANLYGMIGGMTLSAVVVLCFLGIEPFLASDVAAWHGAAPSDQAVAVTFALIGVLWGRAREREAELRSELRVANQNLRRGLERTVQAFRSAIAAKDTYTEGHTSRVARFAVEVGKRPGMDDRELDLLEVASLLHDVGKIGVPESVLLKPGPLDEEEAAILRRHPEIGARMLEQLEGFERAAEIVLHHQERWDGRTEPPFPGYPDGLAGEAIPLGARIVAVVDAFDAMTTDRPYRRALGLARATEELQREAGAQFDPRVVETFLDLVAEKSWER